MEELNIEQVQELATQSVSIPYFGIIATVTVLLLAYYILRGCPNVKAELKELDDKKNEIEEDLARIVQKIQSHINK